MFEVRPSMCRICAVESDDNEPLFDSSESSGISEAGTMFTASLKIQLTPDDGYPQTICFRCNTQLRMFHEFLRGALRMHKKYTDTLEKMRPAKVVVVEESVDIESMTIVIESSVRANGDDNDAIEDDLLEEAIAKSPDDEDEDASPEKPLPDEESTESSEEKPKTSSGDAAICNAAQKPSSVTDDPAATADDVLILAMNSDEQSDEGVVIPATPAAKEKDNNEAEDYVAESVLEEEHLDVAYLDEEILDEEENDHDEEEYDDDDDEEDEDDDDEDAQEFILSTEDPLSATEDPVGQQTSLVSRAKRRRIDAAAGGLLISGGGTPCTVCGKQFKRLANLHKHVCPRPEDQLSFSCDQCGATFPTKQRRDCHAARHTNHRPVPCDRCDKSFKNKYDLKVHQRSHDDTRLYVCPICGNGFRARTHLNNHVDSHASENNYPCTFCPQKYKTQITLTRHIVSMHTNKNEFRCEECGKTFGLKFRYERHLKIHQRKKPSRETTLHTERVKAEDLDVDEMEFEMLDSI